MGKAYANRKSKEERHKNDFYATPKGLVYELINSTNELENIKTILEPCCGEYAISNILIEKGFKVTSKDIVYGNDFLKDDYSNEHYDCVVTNPPFDKWNEIVNKSQEVADKVIVIGRTNYFGSHERNTSGFWNNLSDVYIFDRQIAYDGEFRDDGKAKCGCLITGWFVFKKNNKDLPKIHILDIQKWIVSKKDL